MNCKNCGAPLRGHVCEYCGTEYAVSQKADVEKTLGELKENIQRLKAELSQSLQTEELSRRGRDILGRWT